MTNYCISCSSPGERDEMWYIGVEVFPLYNSLSGRAFHSHKWRESFHICDECEQMFLTNFHEECKKETEVPPAPSHEKKSTPCQHCGEHQFKNDARVRVRVGHKYGRGEKATVSVCFECFERTFESFNIDTTEPLRKVGPLSMMESRHIDSTVGGIRSYIGGMVSGLK